MPNQQLTGYIKQQLEKGADGERIKKILLDTGWAEGDVNEAFAAAQGPNCVPAPGAQAAKAEGSSKSRSSDIVWLIFTGIMVFIAIAIFFSLGVNGGTPIAAKNATIRAYLDQLRSTAMIYANNNDGYGYAGLENNSEYSLLCRKIEEKSGTPCQAQISDKSYCVKAKLIETGQYYKYYDEGYWCVDSNGYSGQTGDSGCTAQKISCE